MQAQLASRLGTASLRSIAPRVHAKTISARPSSFIASAAAIPSLPAASDPSLALNFSHTTPEPPAKTPTCTMTMSLDDEDEDGALTSWENAPGPIETAAWEQWMGDQLSKKLVSLQARTSRAQVQVTGVHSATVIKGRKRAHEIEFTLDLQASHRKDHSAAPVSGSMRVALKTVDQRDIIDLSPVSWSTTRITPQLLSDFTAAAESPLESALAEQLNDLLWDVEKRSMEESMASMDE